MHTPLSEGTFALNGPWRFHTGDDARWADPAFDDSGWETVDLTPQPGDHDPDVGLTRYVPGWQAKGHRGYFGYAWYRLRVSIEAPSPAEKPLALCGPFYVDNAYQIFINGRSLGGSGDFSSRPPTAYNNHLPRIYVLPPASTDENHSALIAIRVWMGPWFARSSDTGGIHIAPILGTLPALEPVYRLEWRQIIRGYVVDGIEAVLFLLLAAMVGTLIWRDRSHRVTYLWMAVALILLALRRGNQPVFFWWQLESLVGFELITLVLLIPACLGAWTIAWRSWFGLHGRTQVVLVCLTLLYMAAECARRSWFYGVLPPWTTIAARVFSTLLRLSFLIVTVWAVARGVRRNPQERWFVVPAVVSISVGLFADELSSVGVPGIWFPFGVGVSRTQYAYAAFDIALIVLLLQRLHGTTNALNIAPSRGAEAHYET